MDGKGQAEFNDVRGKAEELHWGSYSWPPGLRFDDCRDWRGHFHHRLRYHRTRLAFRTARCTNLPTGSRRAHWSQFRHEFLRRFLLQGKEIDLPEIWVLAKALLSPVPDPGFFNLRLFILYEKKMSGHGH
jgi:hypothetical protein